MRILLDENLDWRLARDLVGHDVRAVVKIGWLGLENGALLEKAERDFDVFITMDSNLVQQQSVARAKLSIIALQAKTNRLADTQPLMPKVCELLPKLQPDTVTLVLGR